METVGGVQTLSSSDFILTEWAMKATTIVAIVLQGMEFFYQFFDEVDYLWKMRVRLVTFLYVWSRYFALVIQMINFVLAEMLFYSPDQKTCWRTYILRAVTVQISTTCVEAILMVRVHALYNCSYRSRLILVTAFSVGAFLEFAGSIVSVAHIQPGPGGDLCSPEPSGPLALALFASGWGVIQITVILMTASQLYFSRKGGRVVRTPMVSLMLREGISIFLLIAIVFGGVTAFEVLRRYMTFGVAEGGLVWNAAYAWYMSLISIAGCRMILTMRKLAAQHLQNRLPYNQATLSSVTELSAIIYSDDEEST